MEKKESAKQAVNLFKTRQKDVINLLKNSSTEELCEFKHYIDEILVEYNNNGENENARIAYLIKFVCEQLIFENTH